MSAITPQSNLRLLKVAFGNTRDHTFDFDSVTAQTNFFKSLTYYNSTEYDNFTYQRASSVIRFPAHIDNIRNYNYVMYNNDNYLDKWFYAFITNMEYVNDNMTYIYIETDTIQTWMFNYSLKNVFVERETVSDDTIGKHTVPENLETGEYVCYDSAYFDTFNTCKIVIQVTEWSSSTDNPLATNYGGVYMAGGAYICDNMTQVVSILQAYASAGKSDAVYNVYMVPSAIVNNTSGSLQYSGQSSPITQVYNVTKPTSMWQQTVRNKKLLTFPYNYLLVSNNNGSSNIYHWERFSDSSNCQFSIVGAPVVGGSIKLTPADYDDDFLEENGLIAGKFPTLNWANDEYTNWLTQNSVNIGLGIAGGALEIVGGTAMVAAGNVKGVASIGSGIANVAGQLATVYQHSLQPNSARGNVNGGDINVCSNKNGFYFYKMGIKKEYLTILDTFFDVYGYQVNEIKTPSTKTRTYWNYIKTRNCDLYSSTNQVPNDDLINIAKRYDNGITFWHNMTASNINTNYMNYSNSNSILS